MIPRELEAEILRLYHAEKWRVGTIALQLGVHRDTVLRVLEQDGVPRARVVRPSMLDPYLPFVRELLERFPRLPASRLHVMCRQRGYSGSASHFRRMIARLRPRRPVEAYLRLRTLPGEQAQVDWGHFGKLAVGRTERALVAFVMVLSWSRQVFLRFFLGQQTENFLRGHEAAFSDWGGVPRVVLYDNLKSAVLERQGTAIRFNPTLLEFAGHYRFEPRPVARARGNEKGRVERAIRFVRTSFWPARRWRDLDDLNRQALEWCHAEAGDRNWPEDSRRRVREVFAEERSRLLELPETAYPTEERREVSVGKTPYARFDGNDYSVPHELARRTVVVLATLARVRIVCEGVVVADHPRSFDRGQQVEAAEHVRSLERAKSHAGKHRGMHRLTAAAPSTQRVLEIRAARGDNLGTLTARLLALLDTYGARRLETATREALERDVPHHHAIRQIIERDLSHEHKRPPLPVGLPDDPRVRDLTVRPHDLSTYDNLDRNDSNSKEDDDDQACATAQ